MPDSRNSDLENPPPEAGTSRQSATLLPAVAENACYLIFTYESNDSGLPAYPRTTLATLQTTAHDNYDGAQQFLSDDALASIGDKHLQAPLWEPEPLTIGSDLHPHIRRLLGADVNESRRDTHALSFRLGAEARRLLLEGKALRYDKETPPDARQPWALRLTLSAAARRRISARDIVLGDDEGLMLTLNDVRLIAFRTGHLIVMMQMSFFRADSKPLDPYLIVEGVHSLSRFNELRWQRTGNSVNAEQQPFAMGALANKLADSVVERSGSARVFTATYLQLDSPATADALERLGVQLARHYTDDYWLDTVPTNVKVLSDFENLRHLFSLEGCATLINGKTDIEFIENFRTKTYQTHYLPIILLRVHELAALIELSNASSIWITPGDDESRHKLEILRDRILKFRLCFRFAYISHISMHNEVNQALCEVFGLDRMIEETDQDIREITAYLQSDAAHRSAKRFRFVGVVAAAGLAWLTVADLAKIALKALQSVLHLSEVEQSMIAALVGVAAALLTGAIAWLKSSDSHGGHHDGHDTQQAIEDYINHRARIR